MNKYRVGIPLILFLFFISFSYSLEECTGETITPEEIPCYLLIPYVGDCSAENISVFNSTDLLYISNLGNFTGNQCNATFNQTDLGTYTFLYSFGDTGNIVVEESKMIDIFHILVYGVLGCLGLIFMLMIHIFQKDNTSMVYGALSSATWLLIAAINLSGFELIRNVSFIVDINYYVVALSVILSLYTGVTSYFFYKDNYRVKESPYAMRK